MYCKLFMLISLKLLTAMKQATESPPRRAVSWRIPAKRTWKLRQLRVPTPTPLLTAPPSRSRGTRTRQVTMLRERICPPLLPSLRLSLGPWPSRQTKALNLFQAPLDPSTASNLMAHHIYQPTLIGTPSEALLQALLEGLSTCKNTFSRTYSLMSLCTNCSLLAIYMSAEK